MKILTLIMTLFFAGAASTQTINADAVSGSVGTLNQVTPETDEDGTKIESPQEQQEVQEKIYWDQKRREDKEWEKQKQINDHRFDVPGP